VLLSVTACARTDGDDTKPVRPTAEVVAARPDVPAPQLTPVAVATRWLDALRDEDQNALASYTRYPFELHDDADKCTAQATASSSEQLGGVLNCFWADPGLMDVLRKHDTSAVEPLLGVHLAEWAQRWHVTPPPMMQIITGYFGRQDARVSVDLLIDDGGVRAAWKSGLNGSRAVQVVSEWLAALGDRDLEHLSRVTSYPFEVRDQRREALCGKRAAKARDNLKAAVDCLFRGELLHRALVDSPSPGFTADEPTDSRPDWIEPWWREQDHAALQRVSTMVSTVEGYEFDFQMLVARDGGVRVVWKLGGFESRQ
jgi:hypothetical protein